MFSSGHTVKVQEQSTADIVDQSRAKPHESAHTEKHKDSMTTELSRSGYIIWRRCTHTSNNKHFTHDTNVDDGDHDDDGEVRANMIQGPT